MYVAALAYTVVYIAPVSMAENRYVREAFLAGFKDVVADFAGRSSSNDGGSNVSAVMTYYL